MNNDFYLFFIIVIEFLKYSDHLFSLFGNYMIKVVFTYKI